MSDDKKRNTTERARRIWLAGLGAYGRAFTETKEAFKEVTGEASEVFDDLVQKGQMVEMAVGAKSKEALDKAGVSDLKMPDLKMPDLNLDDRISKMRERLKSTVGFESADAAGDEIEDRVAALEDKMEVILGHLEALRKPAAKPSAAKKTTPKKTAAKKTVTRKTAAKKQD